MDFQSIVWFFRVVHNLDHNLWPIRFHTYWYIEYYSLSYGLYVMVFNVSRKVLFKTLKVPIWFDKIENNEFGLSEFEILKLKSEIQSDENTTRAGRSELEQILDDWRLPRNQNGEPAHIPKPGTNGLKKEEGSSTENLN